MHKNVSLEEEQPWLGAAGPGRAMDIAALVSHPGMNPLWVPAVGREPCQRQCTPSQRPLGEEHNDVGMFSNKEAVYGVW